jgi:uncharacterized membrane protein SirB2
MEFQLINKIIHMSMASLILLAVFGRAFTLFVGTQGNLPNPVARPFFVAVQHLAVSLVVVTGLIGLYLKNFAVEPWFYAKVILFLVLLSSLMKAYRKDDNIALQQRRAGLFLAVVSLLSIIGLVIIKPNFG